MTRFAFVIHPLEPKEAARRYPIARFLPDRWIESLIARKRPMVVSKITGIRSITGEETEGWFIGCPLTPRLLTGGLPVEAVYERLQECGRLAEAEGAEIMGLGAFTSVAGDGGITLAEHCKIGITTGNSYTTATAIEGLLKAAGMVGIVPGESTLAVVGATGSIGKTCARLLAPGFARTIVIGRDAERTGALAADLVRAKASTDMNDLLEADAVVTVTSSDTAVIEPRHLKRGAVVCDVSRPRDVSGKVTSARPDVLVIEGGVVSVPGAVEFGFDFGFPPRTAYACMSETMMLALEHRIGDYTLGKDVGVDQVQETMGWAKKHGFELAGFRSFERAVEQSVIDRVREARRVPVPA